VTRPGPAASTPAADGPGQALQAVAAWPPLPLSEWQTPAAWGRLH
jgi:hypothetical protein